MRHPIERLVSAYRDRIAGLKASYAQYAAMARTLKLKRRDAVLEVRYKPRRGRKGAKEVVTRRPISVPSWPEFVKFILVLPTVKDVSSKHGNNIMDNQNICISNIYTSPGDVCRTRTGRCTRGTAAPASPTSPTSCTWRTGEL